MKTTIRQRLVTLIALNKLKEYRFTDDDIRKVYQFSDQKYIMLKLVMLKICGFNETFKIIIDSESFGSKILNDNK